MVFVICYSRKNGLDKGASNYHQQDKQYQDATNAVTKTAAVTITSSYSAHINPSFSEHTTYYVVSVRKD